MAYLPLSSIILLSFLDSGLISIAISLSFWIRLESMTIGLGLKDTMGLDISDVLVFFSSVCNSFDSFVIIYFNIIIHCCHFR